MRPLPGTCEIPRDADEAVALQEALRHRVVTAPNGASIRTVAGVDVDAKGGVSRAAVVVLRADDLTELECACAEVPTPFPYVPGLLSFRELPAIAAAFGRLRQEPDLLLVDGQGLIHPRRFGVACHVGVAFDLPAIGIGKNHYLGDWIEPGRSRGSFEPVVHEGETVGAVVRTQDGVKPVWVSVGHRVDLDGAVDWALRCAPRYRLPEPIRAADRAGRGR